MTDEKGEPVNYDEDTLEVTREYKKYLTKKEKGVQFSESEIKYYEKVKQGFIKGQQDNDNYKALRDLSLKVSTNKASKKELESYNNWSSKRPKFKGVDGASKLYKILFGMLQNYNLNLKLTRSDNPDDFSQTQYGNNDVKGPDSSHGTHVAGIIAGVRNNGNRMKGVATNVEIMSLRAVPNGDERDKDIALAIRYAADNGADIINMSFGKSYSPNKKEVDAAFEYAVSKGVLLFNAAGNSSKDLDDNFTYPNQFKGDDRNQPIPGVITVGASAPSTEIKAKIEIDNDTKEKYVDEWLSLTADFSNHGSEAVHLFAPGHGIYSATPENNYEKYNGTSMASPAAAGVAALVKGNFPHLTNLQLAEALIDNIRTYEALPVIKPGTNELILFKDLTSSVGVIDAYKVFEALSL